ncbi:MAG TPA: L,D-transpeptidase family protein [Clostridiaceae bacterium]|nr:L,D-transpeptidase family protein [Clostridiaceae bacterium]
MWGWIILKKGLYIIFFALIILVLFSAQKITDNANKPQTVSYTVDTEKKNAYCIFIEIEDKTLYLLQDGKCIKQYPIASGKKGWPSPLGHWKIISKADWGEGFGGRWMGLNVPWGTYGIHGTTRESSIGRAASHGCIRMYNKDIKELYDIVPHGTPVIIVNGIFGPFGTGFTEINPGDRGAHVLAIQKRLKQLGFFKGWESGIYEDDLKYAVHRFQKSCGLTVQNTITKKCWEAMGFREFE